MSNQLNGKPESSGQINTVSTVESECHPVETDVRNTAYQLVKQPSIGSIQTQPNDQKNTHSCVTVSLPIGKRNRYSKTCEACGDNFIAKRPWGKYCGSACRQAAFRFKQSEVTI